MARGLMVNQIGYETHRSVRFVFRADDSAAIEPGTRVDLVSASGAVVAGREWEPWGELWQQSWWVATFDALDAGTYTATTEDTEGTLWREEFTVAPNVLFDATVEHVALGQFERRALIPTTKGNGWIDCGAYLSEANSHAVSVIGMVHLLSRRGDDLSADQRDRLVAQIEVGCNYFLFLADEAGKRDLPSGTYQHEPVNATAWLLEDSLQIGIALCLAAGSLPNHGKEELAARLIDQAKKTHTHLQSKPLPGGQGFSRHAHALDEPHEEPSEWMTRELLLYLEFVLRLSAVAEVDVYQESVETVEQVAQRYRSAEAAGGESPSHFVPAPRIAQPEVAWCHNSVGRDTGGLFPNWVLPLHLFAEQFPDSPAAPRARQIVAEFLDSYIRAADAASPFSLLPNTWKLNQGWLYFAGLWHGMNSSYALMAMQLFALNESAREPWIDEMAWAQLDWIAGLNCGLTHESQYACVMSSYDVPAGVAWPVSMIYGVGRRYAGSWRTIRGSICNGFSRGQQFHFDVEPQLSEDRPEAFTDEDWITHGGAWLAALAFAPESRRS